jgi:propanol-preferring alcohol dehydrogenase
MRAMILETARTPLREAELPPPKPNPEQVLIRVHACGVCRTDLHVINGELTEPKLPLVPGHEIVGTVAARGERAERFAVSDRVGVPWLGYTCGSCPYCRSGRENLCDHARFTGYQIDGGSAEYTVADQRYCFAVPPQYPDAEAAPLFCAGRIGYRSYRMAGQGRRLWIYGFGAAAHIIAQVARHDGREVYASPAPATPRDRSSPASGARPGPETPPPGRPRSWTPRSSSPRSGAGFRGLRAMAKGGTVVCAGIHRSDIPALPYHLLWGNAWCARLPTSRARTARSSWPWHPGCRCAPRLSGSR